jgi:hydrogenase maturation protease
VTGAASQGATSQGATSAPGKVLIAGIGNVFLGDDGFGVAVAARLAGTALPKGVEVVDYGIRGMHLAYDLANGYDAAILVDATPRGGTPGTIYVIEPDLGTADPCPAGADMVSAESATPDPGGGSGTGVDAMMAASPLFDAHGMQPDVVFGMLDMLGGDRPGRILVVGCEPASVDYGMELSEPVAAAVDDAVRVVLDMVTTGPAKLLSAELSSAELSGGGVDTCASAFPVR